MPQISLSPFWRTNDYSIRLYLGHVIHVLQRLPARSVHMCVTSPPYWALRDYGTALVDPATGDANCEHDFGRTNQNHKGAVSHKPGYKSPFLGTAQGSAYLNQGKLSSMTCLKCGAKRIDNQLGSEATPQEYVANMVAVFREVRRVLRDDGTLWLNLGDSYSGGKTGRDDKLDGGGLYEGQQPGWQQSMTRNRGPAPGIPSGNLVGIPWRVALALQEDGWILRSEIVWFKPSPMPESVRNRPTKAHEQIFLLTKQRDYFYDADAIKVKATPAITHVKEGSKTLNHGSNRGMGITKHTGNAKPGSDDRTGNLANKRSVWSIDNPQELAVWLAENYPETLDEFSAAKHLDVWRIASQAYTGAHFATFPQRLIEPCILAGTSEGGACCECGAPFRRVTDRETVWRERPNRYVKRTGAEGTGNYIDLTKEGVAVKTLGFAPSCTCYGPTSLDVPLADRSPCVVLDPFIGSGTTSVVALKHGRHSVGIDLSKDYLLQQAIPRITGALLSRPATAHLVPGHKARRVELGEVCNE